MADLPYAWLLRLLKVPPAPEVPAGDVRVFRSAPGHRRYQLLGWGLRQVGLVAGLVVGAVFLGAVVPRIEHPLAEKIAWGLEGLAWLGFLVQFPIGFLIARIDYAFRWYILSDRSLRVREGFLVQFPIGFLIARIDYAFRWYILSDRSLRVREGLLSYQEKTMTFANIQQVSILQNPVQRLFGISDVKVESAGGGGARGAKDANSGHGEHLHEAHFRGVSNPAEIRDVILARVRMHRDAGLGEAHPVERAEPGPPSTAALEAARELLSEMRALRQTLPPRPDSTPAE